MPFIYKPFRQTMSPINEAIDPSINNIFSVNVNGQICNGYRFKIFDMNNNLIPTPSTNLVKLSTPLYDGDALNITVASGSLTAGDHYKWQVEMYSTFLNVTNVDIVTNMLTVSNHNLLNGDAIFIQSTEVLPTAYSYAENWSASSVIYSINDRVFYTADSKYYKCKQSHTSSASILPTNTTYWDEDSAVGLNDYTKYYVRVYDKNTILLFENIEASKNNQGALDIVTTGGGEITISNIATSDEMPFTAYDVPTLTLSVGTITSQSNTFIPTYSHPQGVLVNSFQCILYNSSGEIIDDSGIIYSSNLKYYFTGFLSNTTYGIRFKTTNNLGQTSDTGIVSFNVVYGASNVTVFAKAENICKDSCIKVSWGDAVQIAGTVTGTYNYVENYLSYGNYGINLNADSILTYENVVMGENASLPIFLWQPSSTLFVGLIAEFINNLNNKSVKIYYDGEKFYQDRDGIIINNNPLQLTENGVYLIAIVDIYLYTNLIATV